MHASHKTLRITLHFSRKALLLLRVLFLLGTIATYYLSLNSKNEKFLNVFPAYYKLIPLTKHIKLLSTPSHSLFISYKALRLLEKRVGSAAYLISTSIGIITHREAVRKKIGGILLGFVFL